MIKSMAQSSITRTVVYRSLLAGNDYYNPILPYWLALTSAAGNNDVSGSGIAVDGSGNVYFGSEDVISGYNSINSIKLSSTLGISWQRTLGVNANNVLSSNEIFTDSSSNVYGISQNYQYSPTSGAHVAFVKYNSSGTIQWQKDYNNSNLYGGWVDSSGNSYATGTGPMTSYSNDCFLVKVASDGSLSWQRRLYGSSYEAGHGVATDSSGNVYVSLNSAGLCYYAKWSSSGSLQWQNRLNMTSFTGGGVAIDSSNNMYFSGQEDSYDTFLAKVDSSGTLQWQRKIGSSSGTSYEAKICVDSSSNVYTVTIDSASGSYDLYLSKWDSSGTIQWQRKVTATPTSGTFYAWSGNYWITTDNTYLYVSSAFKLTGGYYKGLFMKLPLDGSLAGPIKIGDNWVTISASSLTTATTSYSASSGNLTNADPGMSYTTTTYTDQAGTQTVTNTPN